MDIPNLSNTNLPKSAAPEISFSLKIILGVVFLSAVTGFWLSRFYPTSTTTTSLVTGSSNTAVSTDKISSADEIKPGVVYGNSEKAYKDVATGTLERGSINGEGTHILNRPGGPSQRASLISSSVDLDLFIGKNVEVHGETNASNKTSWLLDVGNIKVVE